MFFGLYLCRGLCIFRLGGFFGLCLPFLCQQGGFAFLDTFMAFLIHLIISTFNFGERVGHVLTGKIEQEGGSSVIAVCAFEVVYWKIQCKLPPKTKRFCPLVLK